MEGLGLGEKCIEIAALKWLSYLTDANNAYHRKMVAKLADLWIHPKTHMSDKITEAYKIALARRMEFARHMLNVAQGEFETRLAFCYISNDYSRAGSIYRNTSEHKAAFDAAWKYCCSWYIRHMVYT